MLNLLLVMSLGFLGSFGHCLGMCGPLTVAFSLSQQDRQNSHWYSSLKFNILLNLGRISSYSLVGSILGGLSSLAIFSGQLAGVGSSLRQTMTIMTGLMLIWLGLMQINPRFLPQLPMIHPIQGKLHQHLTAVMTKFSIAKSWWTPAVLGGFWGLIPCGFLYTAQIKAAETASFAMGALTMLAFGIGTMPTMFGIGISASRLSIDRRNQLFYLGGWVTLIIGVLTLFRTDAMVDVTGHGALFLFVLALVARPISRIWATPLKYRRAIGVGAFILSIAHTAHMLDHTLQWNWSAVSFLLPQHQIGLLSGGAALLLMTPAALTSLDYWQQVLGIFWRRIHLLSVPGLILAVIHTIAIGSHYLGELQLSWENQLRTGMICLLTIVVLLARICFRKTTSIKRNQ